MNRRTIIISLAVILVGLASVWIVRTRLVDFKAGGKVPPPQLPASPGSNTVAFGNGLFQALGNTHSPAAAQVKSPQGRNNPTHVSSITIDSLRPVVDMAMSKMNAEYAAHQPMTAADGSTQSVSFVYWIRQETSDPPSLAELTKRMSAAVMEQKEASRFLKDAINRNDQDAMRTAAAAQINASRTLAGEDSFVTIGLSLSTDYPPLLMFHKGLPDWLVFQEQARVLANSAVGSETTISAVMRASPLSTPILVFSNAVGRVAYVDIKSMKVNATPPRLVGRRAIQDDQSARDREARISSQWQEFFANGFNVAQFSLDGLTDVGRRKPSL